MTWIFFAQCQHCRLGIFVNQSVIWELLQIVRLTTHKSLSCSAESNLMSNKIDWWKMDSRDLRSFGNKNLLCILLNFKVKNSTEPTFFIHLKSQRWSLNVCLWKPVLKTRSMWHCDAIIAETFNCSCWQMCQVDAFLTFKLVFFFKLNSSLTSASNKSLCCLTLKRSHQVKAPSS